jgi:hypothetical protein
VQGKSAKDMGEFFGVMTNYRLLTLITEYMFLNLQNLQFSPLSPSFKKKE